MIDQLKKLVKFALVGALIFSAVQFSFAYVNRLQLLNIMTSEALDGRRNKSSAEAIRNGILVRAQRTGVSVPEDVELSVEVPSNWKDDIIVTATYVQLVNLIVYQVPLPMDLEARDEAANN